jgi:membrane fusion protein (multidrug efflux system)
MSIQYILPTKVLSLVGLVLFLGACSSKKNASDAALSRENFQVMSPVLMDTSYNKEYVADIQALQHIELRARVTGYLEKIHVDEGQQVKQGQILFTISSQEYREELLRANAQLKSAIAESKVSEVELKNTKTLVDKNVVSASELEMVQAKLEAVLAKIDEAKSAVSSAQLNLSLTQVKAPFSGIINREPNKVGSLIEEGTLLTTISSQNDVYAYFNLPEKEYLEFEKQNKAKNKPFVSLQMADGELHAHPGTIETVASEIDKNTGSITFRARFPNPQQVLKHGSSGKVLVHNELKNVLVIPQKSTFEIQENLYVFVVDDKNVVEMKSFSPKLRLSHLYVVDSGLSSQDRFIYEGIQRVKAGDIISPELVQFKTILPQLATIK